MKKSYTNRSCISHNCPRYIICKFGKMEDPKSIPKEMDSYSDRVTGTNALGDPIYACGPAGNYALYEPGPNVLVVSNLEITTPPSRICALCDTLEYEGATMARHEKFWLCPTCLGVLRKIVQERTNTQYPVMKHHD